MKPEPFYRIVQPLLEIMNRVSNKLLIVAVIPLLFNCKDAENRPDSKVFVPEWDLFRIKVDKREFWIPYDEDSSLLVTQLPDSVTKNFKPDQETHVSKKILISQSEKDTILKLAIDAITKPVLTTQEVSCYAGQYLTMSLSYARGTKLECKYSSVSSWTSISTTLKRISEMTFEKYGR